VRATIATDDHAVYRTDGDALVNLCLSQHAAWTNTSKRKEQNLIVRSGKCEVEITNNKKTVLDVGPIVLPKLTTDRHEASRGLSATAELHVIPGADWLAGCCVLQRVKIAQS